MRTFSHKQQREGWQQREREQHRLQLAMSRLQGDGRLSQRTKDLVARYVRDAALGKTIIGRAKKCIGASRLESYVNHLTTLSLFVQKDLDAVDQNDIEAFVDALNTDQLRSRQRFFCGQRHEPEGRPFSERYKVEIKVNVRKFYKWLWGRSRKYPALVEWIDTSYQDTEVSALTPAQVERLIDYERDILHRAIIQVLFDGGFRLGELTSVQLRHLRLRVFDPSDPQKRCFSVRVPRSKTIPRTVVLPMRETQKWLGLWLENHPARPQLQPDGTLHAVDLTAPLFPLQPGAIRLFLHRAGWRVLNRRVYPHLLRHTSATYWCNRLPYFKFCKRFGWTMTSDMPQRYIDVEGIDDLEVAQIYFRDQASYLGAETYTTVLKVGEMD